MSKLKQGIWEADVMRLREGPLLGGQWTPEDLIHDSATDSPLPWLCHSISLFLYLSPLLENKDVLSFVFFFFFLHSLLSGEPKYFLIKDRDSSK